MKKSWFRQVDLTWFFLKKDKFLSTWVGFDFIRLKCFRFEFDWTLLFSKKRSRIRDLDLDSIDWKGRKEGISVVSFFKKTCPPPISLPTAGFVRAPFPGWVGGWLPVWYCYFIDGHGSGSWHFMTGEGKGTSEDLERVLIWKSEKTQKRVGFWLGGKQADFWRKNHAQDIGGMWRLPGVIFFEFWAQKQVGFLNSEDWEQEGFWKGGFQEKLFFPKTLPRGMYVTLPGVFFFDFGENVLRILVFWSGKTRILVSDVGKQVVLRTQWFLNFFLKPVPRYWEL